MDFNATGEHLFLMVAREWDRAMADLYGIANLVPVTHNSILGCCCPSNKVITDPTLGVLD